MIDFIPPRPEPELLGGPLTPTVVTIPHVASAVPAARLRRHEKAATAIALRWGLDAASSLLAALDSAATAPSYAVVVREFGPLAWVEHGKTMMTPLFLTPLFVHRGAWVGWPTGQGLKTAIAEAADACLAEPERVLEAICEVTRARVLESPELVQQQHPDAPPSVLALAQASAGRWPRGARAHRVPGRSRPARARRRHGEAHLEAAAAEAVAAAGVALIRQRWSTHMPKPAMPPSMGSQVPASSGAQRGHAVAIQPASEYCA
jgi:hypothetical protein